VTYGVHHSDVDRPLTALDLHEANRPGFGVSRRTRTHAASGSSPRSTVYGNKVSIESGPTSSIWSGRRAVGSMNNSVGAVVKALF